MNNRTRKIVLWCASVLAFLFACFCALGLIQAGSIYGAARAMANLRFWRPLMIGSSLLAVALAVLAVRTPKE